MHSRSASVLSGFSLHCASRASAHDQAARLRLFRYVLRPAIAASKLAFDGSRVSFTMKRTLSDGRSVLHLSPEAFIRRIALLVPRPRQHEIVYFGLFAANAKDRAKVVRERCGGRARLVATTTQRDVIEKILAHLGLRSSRANPAAPRAPPAQLPLPLLPPSAAAG